MGRSPVSLPPISDAGVERPTLSSPAGRITELERMVLEYDVALRGDIADTARGVYLLGKRQTILEIGKIQDRIDDDKRRERTIRAAEALTKDEAGEDPIPPLAQDVAH